MAFILIYAPWPTKKTTVAHHWAMAHRLKTPDLNPYDKSFYNCFTGNNGMTGAVLVEQSYNQIYFYLKIDKNLIVIRRSLINIYFSQKKLLQFLKFKCA